MTPDTRIFSAAKASQSLFEPKVPAKKEIDKSFLPHDIGRISKRIGSSLNKFSFETFYHPYFELLLETINRYGFNAIFEKRILTLTDKDATGDGTTFRNSYDPDPVFVKKPYPVEQFDFDISRPYAQDNWMTFYHIITLIVETLLANNKNDEAITWIENCLYNPKTIEKTPDPDFPGPNAKYWKLPIFKNELTKSTVSFFNDISDGTLQDIVNDLQANPFNPFVVAYRRPQEFMMYVVNLYVRAHIAQGDINFRMAYNGGGMDYLNLALEYYKLAKLQLGQRMETIPNVIKKKPESYQSLKDKGLNPDVNTLVEYENIFPFCSQNTLTSGDDSKGSLLGGGYSFYFSIPADKATGDLHDLIDDRLIKLRNCKDIDGIVRKIDLFGTPINPAQLLAALAKGLSLGQILGNMFSPPPVYKVGFTLQKAKEIGGELKGIGTAIVSAIEKGDAEQLSLMLATHEAEGLNRLLAIKERQVYQAQLEKQALLKSRDTAVFKLNYYQSLLGLSTQAVPPYVDLPEKVDSTSPLPQDTVLSPVVVDVDVSLVDSGERGVKIIPKEGQEIKSMNDAADRQT